jgi:hypothetical protein
MPFAGLFRRSQGGVQFPTGGIARERFAHSFRMPLMSADPVKLRSRRYSPDEREWNVGRASRGARVHVVLIHVDERTIFT